MEPEWLTRARSEGRIKETTVNAGRLASDATTRLVPAEIAVPPPEPGASEKGFQAVVVALAERCGWKVYHTHDSRRSKAGYPDLTMWRGPCLVFAELKDEAGQPTAAQTATLEELSRTGNEAYLWRPEHWPAIVARLAGGQPG